MRLTLPAPWLLISLAAACHPTGSQDPPAGRRLSDHNRLPTGALLDPAGRSTPLGSFPTTLIPAPDSARLLALLGGYRSQGIQMIEPGSGRTRPNPPPAICGTWPGGRESVSGTSASSCWKKGAVRVRYRPGIAGSSHFSRPTPTPFFPAST